MSLRRILPRRTFLQMSALVGGAVALASCAPTPPPAPSAPTSPPGAKAAEPTRAAPPPTAAPAAAPSVPPATRAPEPTKPAAVATTAPAPAATAPPAAPQATAPAKADTKIGKQLIGKLEGAVLVTDQAQFPKTFKEPPALADLAKAGKLPPVKERIGEDPLVFKPVTEIGKYGGQWRRGFTGPGDRNHGLRVAGSDSILFLDYTGNTVVPNIAKGWEVADGGRVTTIFLRRGMKWSDGAPFTADDFVFWYEDIYQNKELVPTPTAVMMINGKPVTLEKVDTYTVRFRSPEPYYLLPDMLSGPGVLGGHSLYQENNIGAPVAPAHYLKEFHPKYVAQDALDKKARDAKMDNWKTLFQFKNSWYLNPELPVATPWKTATPANTPTWTLERNPFSVRVDSEGNQLPYIDRVVFGLAENQEVLNLRAIAGEYDQQERHIDLQKLPVFLENQQKVGYTVHMDPGEYGSDMFIAFNQSYEADPEVARWINNVDFRRALSLGVDRDQLNEAFWLGTGTPSSPVPADSNRYNPGPEYRTLWHTLDVKKANELLDKIGLNKKDADGYRLRSDGKGRLRIEFASTGGQYVAYTQISEMIREQWKKIGVELTVTEMERSLIVKRTQANENQLAPWTNDGSVDLFVYPQHVFAAGETNIGNQGPLFARWFNSLGKQGKEPPPRMKELMQKWWQAFSVPKEEQIKLGKEIWKILVEDVFSIGIVGLGPAAHGVRIVKNDMGNIPSRQSNSWIVKTPCSSRPETMFWKK